MQHGIVATGKTNCCRVCGGLARRSPRLTMAIMANGIPMNFMASGLGCESHNHAIGAM